MTSRHNEVLARGRTGQSLWNAVQLPEVQAMLALERNDASAAVDRMIAAAPFERAYPEAIYIRGMAYLKMRKGAEAVAEFHKIVDREGASWGATWVHPNCGQYYALAYLGMARGHVLAGEDAMAKKAFEDFFALWKDADRDLPILLDARSDYKKLNGSVLTTDRSATI